MTRVLSLYRKAFKWQENMKKFWDFFLRLELSKNISYKDFFLSSFSLSQINESMFLLILVEFNVNYFIPCVPQLSSIKILETLRSFQGTPLPKEQFVSNSVGLSKLLLLLFKSMQI